MMLSQAEFQALVGKNPCLKVRTSSNQRTPANIATLDDSLKEEVKTQKYRNLKVYVTATGISSHSKAEAAKYGKITEVYDSTKEFLRGKSLELMQRAGKIRNLKRQQRWLLMEPFNYQGESIKAVYYKADFQYEVQEKGTWITVVEDVKPFDEKNWQIPQHRSLCFEMETPQSKIPNH